MFLQKLQVYFQFLVNVCYLFTLSVVVKILYSISPKLHKKLVQSMGKRTTMTENVTFEDRGQSFMSRPHLRAALKHMWWSLGQEAFRGGAAPDTPVITMEGQLSSITKFMKGNRPLVLSFGSCTWPPFMFKLEEFKELVKDFSGLADFLVVYMAEAHSSDEWPFFNNYKINQHKSLEERLSAARVLVQKLTLCPVVVDEISNCTAVKYGAMPERLYVLQDGKVVYKGGMGPWGYSPLEVRAFLEKMK